MKQKVVYKFSSETNLLVIWIAVIAITTVFFLLFQFSDEPGLRKSIIYFAVSLIAYLLIRAKVNNAKRNISNLELHSDKLCIQLQHQQKDELVLQKNCVRVEKKEREILFFSDDGKLLGKVTKDSMENPELWSNLLSELNDLQSRAT